MMWALIITLLTVGFVLIVLELLVIPGAIVGIVGAGIMLLGLYFSYATYGTMVGHSTLAITLGIMGVGIYYVIKSNTWKKLTLQDAIDGKVNVIDESHFNLGDKGVTLTKLSLIGKAKINGEIVEVSAMEFMDENTPVEIKHIDRFKIIVKKSIN